MKKTFEDLQIGDILIAKKGNQILTEGDEYPIIESTGFYVTIIDDENDQLICSPKGVDNLFTIKK